MAPGARIFPRTRTARDTRLRSGMRSWISRVTARSKLLRQVTETAYGPSTRATGNPVVVACACANLPSGGCRGHRRAPRRRTAVCGGLEAGRHYRRSLGRTAVMGVAGSGEPFAPRHRRRRGRWFGGNHRPSRRWQRALRGRAAMNLPN